MWTESVEDRCTYLPCVSPSWAASSPGPSLPTSTRPPRERRAMTVCCSAFSCWCGPTLQVPGETSTAGPTLRRRTGPVRSSIGSMSWTPEEFGATDEDEEGIPAVWFTGDAQEIFDQWRDELEIRLRSTELPPALESHLAKYRSLMPSLALIFQLVEFVDGSGDGGAVGFRAALQAAAWCEYLETHAVRLYLSAENPAMEGARALTDRIRKGDVSDGDSTRSVYRKHWSKLSTPEEVSSACSVLEEFGWLRLEALKTGGRSTTRLRIHPILGGATVISRCAIQRGDKSAERVPNGLLALLSPRILWLSETEPRAQHRRSDYFLVRSS